MQISFAVSLAASSILLLSCGDATRSTEPASGASAVDDLTANATLPVRQVTMMDACDPTTFNAALGAGTCVGRGGGVTITKFLDQLAQHGKVGSWINAPPRMTAREGQTLRAINRGGEVHTFTPVVAFGGGIVTLLNELSGNPTVAPECTTLGPGDFVPPGETDETVLDDQTTQRFQCCIHPWMRTTVRTR